MDIREICKEDGERLKRNGMCVLKETKEEIILENETNTQTISYRYNQKFEGEFADIPRINLIRTYQKINKRFNISLRMYVVEFWCEESHMIIKSFVDHENKVSQDVSNITESNYLTAGNSLRFSFNMLEAIKSVLLAMRKYLLSNVEKEYRLRNLFTPYVFDTNYDWLLDSFKAK